MLDKSILNQLILNANMVYPDSKILAAVTVVQAILESNYIGDPNGSLLARKYNNLFGIKGEGTAGSVNLSTHEYYDNEMHIMKQPFAVYISVDDCFQAHKALLDKPRYARVREAGNVEEACQALRDCGYATDPDYPSELMEIYDKYVKQAIDNLQ